MTEHSKVEFKHWFIYVFSSNYLFQGFVTSMFSVIVPIYLIQLMNEVGASVTASDIAFLASIVLLPWSIKFIFGILSDKFGIKRFGRRKPWIIIPVSISGLLWIIIPSLITPQNVVLLFSTVGVAITLGVAIGDTALDGLILDIAPKEVLGQAQGTCWGFRSVGQIAGGPLLAMLVVFAGVSVDSLFIILGILMIASSFLLVLIKEPSLFPEVHVGKNLKQMFSKKLDWKMYLFAIFNAFIDGVVILFLSLFILINAGFLAEGTSLEILDGGTDQSIYLYQANINLIISVGIVLGAVFGGIISDKSSRKNSIYISLILTTAALLLLIIPAHWIFQLVIACMLGAAMGWRHSSYSAVLGQLAKRYPEMDSTYFSIANSFVNIGTVIGLSLVGLIFDASGSFIIVFIAMALISNIGLFPFLVMDSNEYEISKNLKLTDITSKKPSDVLKH